MFSSILLYVTPHIRNLKYNQRKITDSNIRSPFNGIDIV